MLPSSSFIFSFSCSVSFLDVIKTCYSTSMCQALRNQSYTNTPFELGPVFDDVCRQSMYLQHRYDAESRVMSRRVDIKDTFRQIPVDPLHAA